MAIPVLADSDSDSDSDTAKLIATVQGARVFDLSHVWDENSPIAGVNPPYSMELNATHAFPADYPKGTRGTFGAQGVDVRPGDTVLIRTGWGQFFASDPDKYKGDLAAGVGVNGAQWLIDRGARVVGNDTLTFEVRPPIAFPPDVPAFQVFPVQGERAQGGAGAAADLDRRYDHDEFVDAGRGDLLQVVAVDDDDSDSDSD